MLPRGTLVYAVGGVGPADFADWCAAGADGFGLGSSLFQPGWPVARVADGTPAPAPTAFDAVARASAPPEADGAQAGRRQPSQSSPPNFSTRMSVSTLTFIGSGSAGGGRTTYMPASGIA